jgi:peroxin-7
VSASGDSSVKVWDLRQARPTLSMAAHQYEILSADWCKYNDCVLATASVDKSIKLWDVRAPQRELTTLLGHTCAAHHDLCLSWSEQLSSVVQFCAGIGPWS